MPPKLLSPLLPLPSELSDPSPELPLLPLPVSELNEPRPELPPSELKSVGKLAPLPVKDPNEPRPELAVLLLSLLLPVSEPNDPRPLLPPNELRPVGSEPDPRPERLLSPPRLPRPEEEPLAEDEPDAEESAELETLEEPEEVVLVGVVSVELSLRDSLVLEPALTPAVEMIQEAASVVSAP